MKRLIILTAAIVCVIGSLAFGQTQLGQKAPDFTLADIDGNYVTLSKIIGQGPVYINFWATWCAPCKKEIPGLIELYNKYKDQGFKVLAISTDNSRTSGKVKSFSKDRGMNFTVLLDSDQEVFTRKYKGTGIPYGFLLDNEGNILHSVRGFMPGIEKVLEEKMTPYLIPAKPATGAEEQKTDKAPETKNETAK